MSKMRIIQLFNVDDAFNNINIRDKFVFIDAVFNIIEQELIKIKINLIELNEMNIPNFRDVVYEYIKNEYGLEINNKLDRMLCHMAMSTDMNIYHSQIQILLNSMIFIEVVMNVITCKFKGCDIILPSNMKYYGIGLSSYIDKDIEYIAIYNKPVDIYNITTFDKLIQAKKNKKVNRYDNI